LKSQGTFEQKKLALAGLHEKLTGDIIKVASMLRAEQQKGGESHYHNLEESYMGTKESEGSRIVD
jgi:hypothetical protein